MVYSHLCKNNSKIIHEHERVCTPSCLVPTELQRAAELKSKAE